MAKLVKPEDLKKFALPASLSPQCLADLAGKASLEEAPANRVIFRPGDIDKKAIYVISGQIQLISEKGENSMVVADTEVAKHPVANFQPRKHTAIANVVSKIVRVDRDLLDMSLSWDHLSGIEVKELQSKEESGGADWMTRILQSQTFSHLPPANIQKMFMRMKEVQVKAGQTIIKQGEEGDYYYIIKAGKCKVTRGTKTGSALTLATLSDGDSFGEEALLSESKRNANVVMLTNGSLMQLAKEDFDSLLRSPVVNWITNEEADRMVQSNQAVWLDVRLESEYKNEHIPGSVNVPLFMLRLKAQSLDPKKKYILYCDSGKRSSASAFLLSERGLDVYCLKGGLMERK